MKKLLFLLGFSVLLSSAAMAQEKAGNKNSPAASPRIESKSAMKADPAKGKPVPLTKQARTRSEVVSQADLEMQQKLKAMEASASVENPDGSAAVVTPKVERRPDGSIVKTPAQLSTRKKMPSHTMGAARQPVTYTGSRNTKALAANDVRITVIADDVWGDGTGYQMLIDADHNTYGNIIRPIGYDTGYVACGISYAEFEYKLPTNADSDCSTSNILLNTTVSLDIPAGTYDFGFVNPTPGSTPVIWFVSGTGESYGRRDDFVFEAGKEYTFHIYGDNMNGDLISLAITNFNTALPTAPTNFTVTPDPNEALSATLSWTNPTTTIAGAAVGNLTNIIIKRDGALIATYTTNLTPGASCTYVDNTPTNGNHTYSVAATNANGTGDAATASAFVGPDPCAAGVTAFPYYENFEEGSNYLACYQSFDIDGDGKKWTYNNAGGSPSTGDYGFYHTYSASGDNSDGYLVTPKIVLPATGGAYELSFYSFNNYASDYGKNSVLVSTTGADPTSNTFTELWSPSSVTGAWVESKVSLAAYSGQTIYIAFRYEGMYAHVWFIDDVKIVELSDIDVGVSAITAPVNAQNMSATQPVTVTIHNFGGQAQSNVPVKLYFTPVGGSETLVATEYAAGPIASGADYSYTFTATVNMSAGGTYTLRAETALAGDVNANNDGVSKTVTNSICATIGAGWSESFSTASSAVPYLPAECWTSYAYNTLGEATSYWSQTGSGTNPAVTPQDGDGGMIFYNNWSYNTGNVGVLATPQILVDRPLTFSFWVWRTASSYSNNDDNIKIYLNDAPVNEGTPLLTIHGNINREPAVAAEGWYQYEIDIPYSGSTYKKHIVFEGESYYGYNIFVDNLELSAVVPKDAGVTAVKSPVTGMNLTSTETVTITVKNFGTDPITSLPVTFKVDNGSTVTETITATIASKATYDYTFTATANLSAAGNHTITASTVLAGDEIPANDSKTVTVRNDLCDGIGVGFTESFDGGQLLPTTCWTSSSVSEAPWKWAATGSWPTCEPQDGDGGMITYNAFSYYTGFSGLLTLPPVLLTTPAKFTFWMYRDGGYSTSPDRVIAYASPVNSTAGATKSLTVYRSTALAPAVAEAGWYKYEMVVPANTRYIMLEGISGYGNNVFVDNLALEELPQRDASVTKIVSPETDMNLKDETVTVNIKNQGLNTISNFPVIYQINSEAPVTEYYPTTIAFDEEVEFSFATKANLSEYGTYTIKVYTQLAADQVPANDMQTVTVGNFEGYKDAYALRNYPSPKSYTEFDLSTGDYVDLFNDYQVTSTDEEYDGQYIYRIHSDNTIVKVFPDGSTEDVCSISYFGYYDMALGLAYDKESDSWYVLNNYGGYPELYLLDMATGDVTYLAGADEELIFIGLTFDTEGMLWTVDSYYNALYKIDLASGTYTKVGDISGDITDLGTYLMALAYDKDEDALYSIATNVIGSEVEALFGTYNTETAEFTTIKNYGEAQFTSMAITKPAASRYPVTFNVSGLGSPVEGAYITIGDKKGYTDASGQLVVKLKDGNYSYEVTAFGYTAATGNLTIGGSGRTVSIFLTPSAAHTVTFNTLNNLDAPIKASVSLSSDGKVRFSGTADANGILTFNSVPAGYYTANITLASYESVLDAPINVAANVTKVVKLNEIIGSAPFNLEVYVDGASADFTWNNFYGLESFFDSFEDGTLSLWELVQGSGTPGEGGYVYWYPFQNTTNPPNDGTWSAFVNWGYNVDTWLITPNIAVAADTKLSFDYNTSYHWHVSPYSNGDLWVKVSEDDGATWTSLWREEDDPNFSSTAMNWVWMPVTLDLSNYSGKTVKIAFNFVSDDGATMEIDRVSVGNTKLIKSTAGLQKYEVFLDGKSVGTTTGLAWGFESLTNGTHAAGVRGIYDTGNTATSSMNFLVTDGANVPEFVSSSPADGATGVGTEEDITVTFSTNIEADNLSAITLKTGTTSVAVTPSISGKVLKIAHAALAPNTSYVLTVPSGTIKYFSGSLVIGFKTGTSALGAGKAGRINIVQIGEDLVVTGAADKDMVEIYNAAGQIIKSTVSKEIPVVTLGRGMFVVKVNDTVAKVIIK